MAFTLDAHIDLSREPDTEDERYAVHKLKAALNRLGWYSPDPTEGMNDDIDDGLRNAVYAYQRKNTIMFGDTNLGPNSTTERLLRNDLAAMDDNALYIWRTVSDDKVRRDHSARSGRTFSWNAPPDGGHPSEDYNCRCWAEPLNPPYHPWMEWVNEQQTQRFARNLTIELLASPRKLKDDVTDLKTPIPIDGIEATSVLWNAAAILIVLRLGRVVPLPIILTNIKSMKLAQNIQRLTIDKPLFKKPKGIPDDWVAEPVKKDFGIIYTKPGTKGGTYVRINKGNPQSTFEGQRYDYVRWQKDGQPLDINGNPVTRKSLESHIPLKKFKFDLEKIK